jgi:hypothetical protein
MVNIEIAVGWLGIGASWSCVSGKMSFGAHICRRQGLENVFLRVFHAGRHLERSYLPHLLLLM